MDDFNTLSNRLLNRCPAVGIVLAGQFVNDSWQTLQSRREWSWRRANATFAPPNLYQTGRVSTNVAAGNPTAITGIGTDWTPDMVGRQIRLGGLMFPYYTIVGWNSATEILVDQPWAGAEQTSVTYQIVKIYYEVPSDFGYFEFVVSPKDAYRLWTTVTENELAVMDPQRTNQGQTYSVVFWGYNSNYGGTISQPIQVNGSGQIPISSTENGFTYVADATYIIQMVTGGGSGEATFQWMRAGQTSFTGPILTSEEAAQLMDGVWLYWPLGVYVAGDVFVVNCQSNVTESVPIYELWPAPTYQGYIYPYMYIRKEYAISAQRPKLPPFIANRGEVLLEMALEKCATFPGSDANNPNPYYDLRQAKYHAEKAERLLWDLERNDEEIGVTNISYRDYPMAPAPWMTGEWQQHHAPLGW